MKKEICAIILLAILFAAAFWNISFLESFTGELIEYIDNADTLCISGDLTSAVAEAEKAAEYWMSMDHYTHITLRHSEIDSTTDAFFELLSDLYSGDAGAAHGSVRKVRDRLLSLAQMERVTLGSIM